jgi:dephospho-CoA kinase
VLSSDDVVHRLFREDDEVRAALVGRWGRRILDGRGDPDRAAIAAIVFADRDELAWLEALLHPRVARENLRWREELAGLPEPPALCVSEVPLLYETGAESRFDVVVVVTAPAEVRRRRTAVRPDERAGRLLPEREKVRRADFAYVNDGTVAELDAFVASVVAELALRSADDG